MLQEIHVAVDVLVRLIVFWPYMHGVVPKFRRVWGQSKSLGASFVFFAEDIACLLLLRATTELRYWTVMVGLGSFDESSAVLRHDSLDSEDAERAKGPSVTRA